MIYDITRPLSPDTQRYPGDPPFQLMSHSSLARGDPFELTSVAMSSHLGTHVDAPSHFVKGGATIDQLSMETLTGPATVRHIPGAGPIGPDELRGASIPPTCIRLLLRMAPRYLSPDGAKWLVEHGLKLVGTDSLSVDPIDSADFPAHRLLLSAGLLVVESLDLTAVPERDYRLYCLPLKITGAEAAPARAILIS